MANTIKAAKRMVEKERPEVWDILEEVIREHPVLLNRAPTLHRLGIQAFEPVLIEGKAIQLHPLVCTAFNADFDGDQMAVHVPLSLEAQLEARVLMMSTNNILSPASGKPIIVPSQDIVLGIYYITLERDGEPGEGSLFSATSAILGACAATAARCRMHAKIKVRPARPYRRRAACRAADAWSRPRRAACCWRRSCPSTENLPFSLINRLLTKKDLQNVIDSVYRHCGQKETVIFADRLMGLGFYLRLPRPASRSARTTCVIPVTKEKLVAPDPDGGQGIRAAVPGRPDHLGRDATTRSSTPGRAARIEVAEEMMKGISTPTAAAGRSTRCWMMAHSGARGSATQMKQLAGMRGLMTKPSGEIIETPIISNFKEGLSVLEYFNSTHGARKGLADTALKTGELGLPDPPSGRRGAGLHHHRGRLRHRAAASPCAPVVDGGDVIEPLSASASSAASALDDVVDPVHRRRDHRQGRRPDRRGRGRADREGRHRDDAHPLGADLRHARSASARKCYGRDLARGTPVNIGEAVGVIAAQSIGEPGTQLTMRTFHIGGAAQRRRRAVEHRSEPRRHRPGRATVNVGDDQQARPFSVVMGRNSRSSTLLDGDDRARPSAATCSTARALLRRRRHACLEAAS